MDGVCCNVFYFYLRKSFFYRDICVVYGMVDRDIIDYIGYCF